MEFMDFGITLTCLALLLTACAPTSLFDGRLGFRLRRTRNWFMLGCMYACYYLCRHNLGVANKSICSEFGFTRQQFGWIITAAFWSYAVGQCVNGFLADRFGGKRSMLLGAAGTIVLNILFGAASFWGILGVFIAIRLVDGFMQSMGSPGFIKINTAWFSRPERGGFAGIFGFMIQMGQVGITRFIGPVILTGILTVGSLKMTVLADPLHWRYLFWVPSIITAAVAVVMAVVVRSTPEEAGYQRVGQDQFGKVFYEYAGGTPIADLSSKADVHEPVPPALEMLKKILSHRGVWFCAVAYFCTGFVRYGVLNWYLRFLEDFGVGPKSSLYLNASLAVAMVAVLGSLASGFISDLIFRGRRAPVAAALYLLETAIILAAGLFIHQMQGHIDRGDVHLQKVTQEGTAQTTIEVRDAHGATLERMPGIGLAALFMILVALTCNATHSIIGSAAAMDIGGRHMSGFASGVIDSFQYFGGGLAGFFVGGLIDDYGYTTWMLCMAPAGVIGFLCMLIYQRSEQRHDAATVQ